MIFPKNYEFMETFGIEPIEEDSSISLCRYIKKAKNNELEIDISFSATMKSFQVVLRLSGQEISTISSECVHSIKIVSDNLGAGLHVVFDISGTISEARVMLEPDIGFRWWTLSDA
ncbi:hypothetical protein ACIQYF_10930 [Pseudomonas sp. NPDC096917]|uniref:hypothetical protein n=1 Tax=Pseudomonas sp. NPDC096917 TaxID=3364483 RepID=UPI003839F93A